MRPARRPLPNACSDHAERIDWLERGYTLALQSNGMPFIDRDLNYVVFDTRMNDRADDQYSHGGTCMGCHAKAITLAGKDANFSFFLSRAR